MLKAVAYIKPSVLSGIFKKQENTSICYLKRCFQTSKSYQNSQNLNLDLREKRSVEMGIGKTDAFSSHTVYWK